MRQTCCICHVPCGGGPLGDEQGCSAPTVKRCTSCAVLRDQSASPPSPDSASANVSCSTALSEATCPLARGLPQCTGEHFYCCNCSGDPFLERRLPGKEEMASSCENKKCWQCRERGGDAGLDRGGSDRASHQRARSGGAADPGLGSLHRHFSACTVARHINKSFRSDLETPPVLWRVHEEEAEPPQDEAEMTPRADSPGGDMDVWSDEFCNRRWMGGLSWDPAQAPPESMTDWDWEPTPLESSMGGWVVYPYRSGNSGLDMDASQAEQHGPMDYRGALRLRAHAAAAAEPHAALGGKRPRAIEARDPEATPPPPPPHSPLVMSPYSPSPIPARLFFPSGDESMPDWADIDCNSVAGKRHAANGGGSPYWSQVVWPRACDVV